MPPWVLAEWWEPSHLACPNSKHYWGHSEAVRHPCNLPEEPWVVNPSATFPRWRGGLPERFWRLCRWEHIHPYAHGRRATYASIGVPKWFVDHVWNEPERRRERDDLRALRDEYNAHGDLEDGDFPCWQTRGFARWMWD